MQPTLLLLAAGMGTRYGSLKQLDPMGPNGETMLDYAVRDAQRAGFGKVVFVIRRDFETAFRKQVGQRYEDRIAVHYAFQALDDLTGKHRAPAERKKPWGTAHAVWAARKVIEEPFAVINADDFYGFEAYREMARHLSALPTNAADLQTAMIGYVLENTLSPHGSVNRGICTVQNGALREVREHTEIARDGSGRLWGNAPGGQRKELPADAIVSMNFWGFSAKLFDPLEAGFENFLRTHGREMKSEYYLPSLVDELIRKGLTRCPVLKTESPWFGVTYPGDRERVVACLKQLDDDRRD